LVVNRIGDFGFLCGAIVLFYFFRTLDFSIIFVLAPYFKDVTLSFIGLNCKIIDLIVFFYF
jgi:NADH:ubiquinone oxidoreductase subunit 5 (subunit L)/multisubunit Na+/H+ antiporter MnhA subunit